MCMTMYIAHRYGLGDCRKPLQKSATLIEEIVRQQMAVLVRYK